MYHLRTGYTKVKSHNIVKKTISLVAVIVLAIGVAYPLSTNAQAPPSANITINGERSSIVAYGSHVSLSWSSSEVDECVVTPGNWTELYGSKMFYQVTTKQTYKLVCKGKLGTATAYTTFAVAPPTFGYLRDFLVYTPLNSVSNKALVKGMTKQITEAESKYASGRTKDAKKLLDLTVSKLPKKVSKEKISVSDSMKYAAAVQALQSSWSAPSVVPDVVPDDEVKLNPVVIDPVVGTGVNCGGGYPAKWCEIPQDTVIDSWGMYNRESVSYTAFKVHTDFLAQKNTRDMPYWGGIGSANQWDDNAMRAGIPVDTNPAPGAIAIMNAGFYGHAMYVEQVNADGSIRISQYNASWDGRYSEALRNTTGLVFIHF